jgi:HD-GYP domain-containing protein (c-di-GMP phosphodiesterase class II)
VNAAVLAIEQRDPTTEGHSRRVADYTVGLAKMVDRVKDGPFRGLTFSREQLREIKYAGLLHDFGKVGVREKVLVKAKKLYGPDLELIRQRHAFVRRTLERDFWKQRVEFLEKNGEGGYQAFIARIEADLQRELGELDKFLDMVIQSNEPSLLPAEHAKGLTDYAQRTYVNLEGQTQSLLTPDEVRFLTIPKGSLDESERLEIESHVTHTFNFLQQIPWTPELAEIPLIAFGHHEKLDGSGYPKRKRADEILPQTRMMTISDIYDALTAQDRPYKRAVPPTRALDIMSQEVTRGQLDKDLFKVFVDAKVYENQG